MAKTLGLLLIFLCGLTDLITVKNVKADNIALSWGDPVIETVGNLSYKYSFNGHGEYVFFKSDVGFEIQARTDYALPGKIDSTLFTSFVLWTRDSQKSIQIVFDRNINHLSLYDSTGTLWNTTNSCEQSSKPLLISDFFVKCLKPPSDAFHIVLAKTKLNILGVDIFKDDTFMNIKLLGVTALTNIRGLAGNVENGSYIFKNGTRMPVNASESEMFEYGESWSIRKNKTLSHFMYNVTNGTFEDYNNFSRPQFLAEKLSNFTALFENCDFFNTTKINATCKNTWDEVLNKECLLTIARTCNISLGEAVHNNVENQHEDIMKKTNKPPSFNKTIQGTTHFLVNGNTSWILNLTEYVKDETYVGLRFDVEPFFNSEMEIRDSGLFNWTVGTALRGNDTWRTLRFIVYDKYNMSDEISVSFRYCGCEDPRQCKFPSKDDATANCKCPNRYVTGEFCDSVKNPCLVYNCSENNCDSTYTGDGSPCGNCTKGYYEELLDMTQRCLDLNECNDSRSHGCEHECHNLVGSYYCSCLSGYELHTDNTTCKDIDECKLNKTLCPKSEETCRNVPGHYLCVCETGFSKATENSTCAPIVGKMYFGSLDYVVGSAITDTNDTLQKQTVAMTKIFNDNLNGAEGFLAIEIYKIFIGEIHVHLNFIMHMNETLDQAVVQSRIKTKLVSLNTNLSTTLFLSGSSVDVRIYKPEDGGQCDVEPKRTQCLETTTYCVNKNISDDYYDCACLFGYTKPITTKKREIYCDDLDECKAYAGNGTSNDRCVHGECVNTIGSWNCTCSADGLWMSVGSLGYPIYRCQGNHSYLGNISFIWDAQPQHGRINQSVIKSFLTLQISEVFTNESLKKENMTAVPSVFVSVTILENTSYYEIPFINMYLLTYEFLIRLGDPMDTDILQRIGSEFFKNGVTIGAAIFHNITFFNESNNELCRRSKGGNCDIRSTECKQENGTTSCVCKGGFQPRTYTKYSCEDVDECTLNGYTCSGGGTCQNLEGNWACQCPLYTELLNVTDTHKECSGEAYYHCSSKTYAQFSCANGNKTCNNSVWSCDCADGYSLNGTDQNSTCKDDNECDKENPCGNGTCRNTEGGYTCECAEGFQLDENKTSCKDVNECESKKYICQNGDCTNFKGSYTCTCKTGFSEAFTNQFAKFCVDIDECTNKNLCGNGTCKNINGAFTCDCPHGYENYTNNNMSYTCTDIDECKSAQDYHCINGSCKNIDGRWDCVCDVSKYANVKNDNYKECHDVFQYPLQFQVNVFTNPHSYVDTDTRIQASLIKSLSDIINSSFNGSVLFPVQIVPDSYHHIDLSKIEVTVNVVLVSRSSETILKSKFEDTFNKTGGVYQAPTGILFTVAIKKEKKVQLCELDFYDNKCNNSSTKCIQYEDTVKCECRGGFENLTHNAEGVGMCQQITDPKGDYTYLAHLQINIGINVTVNSTNFKKAVQLQITLMYSHSFPNASVWVEVLDVKQESQPSGRKRRESKPMASIEFVLHMAEKINTTELKKAWTNCTQPNSTCSNDVQANLLNATKNNTTDVIIFSSNDLINVSDSEQSLCEVTKMCNTSSTTCTYSSGQAVCMCKPGYSNNTFINDTNSLNSYYECKKADEELVNNALAKTFTITSTTTSKTLTLSASTSTNTYSTISDFSEIKTSEHSTNTGKDVTTSSHYQTNQAQTDQKITTPSIIQIETTSSDHNITLPNKQITSVPSVTTSSTTATKGGVDEKSEETSSSSSNTALIATGASLGSIVLILAIAIIVVCRLRSKKAQDTERIKLRELEKERRNGFDNSLLGRNNLRSNSKQNLVNDLREPDRETDRDDRQNSYYGGPFKPIEPTYTKPFKSAEPEPIWDRNGHSPGLKGRTGSLPDINGHVDMRIVPETRRISQPRNSDPRYTSPRKDKDPTPTQKSVDNYRQNMVRVFPESGERLPRVKTNQFPRKNANGRISPEPDYYDDPPLSPKHDYNGRSHDRVNASRDSGLNGFSRSSGSPEVQRSRESFGYGSLGRGRYRMEDTPF